MTVRRQILACIWVATLSTAVPAEAQFSVSYDFIEAVRESNLVEARQLVRKGLTGNVRDAAGVPVLLIASGNGDVDMMAFLLSEGANIDTQSQQDKETPLMAAVNGRHGGALTFLIERGANLDTRDRNGETALMKAVKLRRTQMVRALLEAGADPAVSDYRGLTALDHARSSRSRTIMGLLEDAT